MIEQTRKVERTGLLWLWLSAAVVAMDQVTKFMIVERLDVFQRIDLFAMLSITRLHNTGAAFSFLSDAGGWQRWFFVVLGLVISLLVIAWLRRIPARRGWLGAALALVVGGAVGNIIDRLMHGYVVDFISVHYKGWFFPAFNVADSSITVGAVILLIESLIAGDGRIPSKRHERVEP